MRPTGELWDQASGEVEWSKDPKEEPEAGVFAFYMDPEVGRMMAGVKACDDCGEVTGREVTAIRRSTECGA